MKNQINKLLNGIIDWLFTPVKESTMFTGEETVLDRYGDFQEAGVWDCSEQDEYGNWIRCPDNEGGKVYTETVKFINKEGKICIGSDWVLKNPEEYID